MEDCILWSQVSDKGESVATVTTCCHSNHTTWPLLPLQTKAAARTEEREDRLEQDGRSFDDPTHKEDVAEEEEEDFPSIQPLIGVSCCHGDISLSLFGFYSDRPHYTEQHQPTASSNHKWRYSV